MLFGELVAPTNVCLKFPFVVLNQLCLCFLITPYQHSNWGSSSKVPLLLFFLFLRKRLESCLLSFLANNMSRWLWDSRLIAGEIFDYNIKFTRRPQQIHGKFTKYAVLLDPLCSSLLCHLPGPYSMLFLHTKASDRIHSYGYPDPIDPRIHSGV